MPAAGNQPPSGCSLPPLARTCGALKEAHAASLQGSVQRAHEAQLDVVRRVGEGGEGSAVWRRERRRERRWVSRRAGAAICMSYS